MNDRQAELKIFRYGGSIVEPRYDTYEVPLEKGLTVLQALFWLKDLHEDFPAFRRFHCNRGQCCSCLMTIDGEIKRACTTEMKDEMVLEPVQDYPVIRDLIVDFGRIVNGRLVRRGTLIQGPRAVWKIERTKIPVLSYHEEKCTGCEMCQQACPVNKLENVNDAFGQKRTAPILFLGKEERVDLKGICIQCANAPCLHFCPAKVISRDPKSGAIVVDKEFCLGCGMCLTACPNEAIFMDMERGKAVKCELCGGRPQCAENCPTGALEFFGE